MKMLKFNILILYIFLSCLELKSVKPVEQTYAYSGDFTHQVEVMMKSDVKSDLISALEQECEKRNLFTSIR